VRAVQAARFHAHYNVLPFHSRRLRATARPDLCARPDAAAEGGDAAAAAAAAAPAAAVTPGTGEKRKAAGARGARVKGATPAGRAAAPAAASADLE
jgi:hypothetical protein